MVGKDGRSISEDFRTHYVWLSLRAFLFRSGHLFIYICPEYIKRDRGREVCCCCCCCCAFNFSF